ncbi:MAG: MBL fold metallo-hydrolase [Bacteroidetes bacterium]|nr:MBL fold metallo-hydrolase [Bacteroidota bacterium]
MSLFISSLNSGSNGNCYYVGNHEEAVLIDVGLNCKETELRLNRLGLQLDRIKAIFISHEHTDHIKGVEVLSKKHDIPVYISNRTLGNSNLKIKEHLIQDFEEDVPISIGNLSIHPFSKHHDAADPYSFTITHKGTRVAVITDIGHACKNVISHFSSCNAAFLEANYDEQMLESGHYPLHLKKRIAGKAGHLSNAQALELFIKHRPANISHLLLSHLSQENNEIELVRNLFIKHAGSTQVEIASRFQESEVFEIVAKGAIQKNIKIKGMQTMQLSLF